MVPQFAHGTSLYPVTAAGLRQVKMDMPSTSTTDWYVYNNVLTTYYSTVYWIIV